MTLLAFTLTVLVVSAQEGAPAPADVVGILLVDAGEDNPARIGPDGTVVRADTLVKGTPLPEIKTACPPAAMTVPSVDVPF